MKIFAPTLTHFFSRRPETVPLALSSFFTPGFYAPPLLQCLCSDTVPLTWTSYSLVLVPIPVTTPSVDPFWPPDHHKRFPPIVRPRLVGVFDIYLDIFTFTDGRLRNTFTMSQGFVPDFVPLLMLSCPLLPPHALATPSSLLFCARAFSVSRRMRCLFIRKASVCFCWPFRAPFSRACFLVNTLKFGGHHYLCMILSSKLSGTVDLSTFGRLPPHSL